MSLRASADERMSSGTSRTLNPKRGGAGRGTGCGGANGCLPGTPRTIERTVAKAMRTPRERHFRATAGQGASAIRSRDAAGGERRGCGGAVIIVIGLAYAAASPIILPCTLIYFAISWTFWRCPAPPPPPRPPPPLHHPRPSPSHLLTHLPPAPLFFSSSPTAQMSFAAALLLQATERALFSLWP